MICKFQECVLLTKVSVNGETRLVMTSLIGQSQKVKHPQKGQDQRQVLVDQVID